MPASQSVARTSVSVAQWTLVSRVFGFARAAVVAAVLGPTYLANTFSATNMVPNLVFELLAGSLLASLLVPALVRHVDVGDRRAAERVAGGFLGLALAGFAAVLVLGLAGGPLLLAALSAAAADPAVADAQRDAGLLLLVLFAPQIVFYALAGIGAAVSNAHGRFALAAAAPAVESLGVIATMAAFVVLYGDPADLRDVTDAQLLLLGLGTTGAVALHGALQWWGAARAGVRLVPHAGWREPEVGDLVRRTVPSLGYAAVNTLRWLAATVAANVVAGGVVAFYLAVALFFLPVALGARPLATAFLPRLARLHQAGETRELRDEYVRGLSAVAFLTIPAAVAFLVLAEPLAGAVSFGELDTEEGTGLVAAALAGMAAGVVGESVFQLATSAAYARDDPRSPLRAMILRTAVSAAGMAAVFLVPAGWEALLALGLAMAAGDVAGAWYLLRRVRTGLPAGGVPLRPAVVRAAAGAALMAGPAFAVAAGLDGPIGALGSVAVAGAVGIAVFLGVQRAWRSPELAFFAGGLGRAGRA